MSDQKIIFSMEGVSKVYKPNNYVLKDIYLSFFHGAKIGVLGNNGSGKSTLLNIIAGNDEEYQGKISRNKGITFGMLPQEPKLDPDKTVKEIVEEGVQEQIDLLAEYEEVNAAFGDPDADFEKLIEKQEKLQEKIEHIGAWDLDSKLDQAMDALRTPPGDTSVEVLSGGEARRVALCRLLLKKPDVLLLDEPTNHLDAESVAWLEQHLDRYEGTVIAVTHDRYFLDNVAGWILELDRGEGIPFEGNYSSWLDQKKKRLEQEEKQESKRQKTLQKELEWIQQNPKGRRSKSKARINQYEELLSEERRKQREDMEIFIPAGPRLGDKVIEANDVSKGYDDRLLIEEMNFSLPPGGIVGVIGPNGAGKSTLFKMITGEEEPDSGSIEIGKSVELGYVNQKRPLDPQKTIWEEISGGKDTIKLGNREVNSRAYTARFNFSGSDQQKRCSEISGGERNRVHLAKMLKKESNVLLLDEPTNDLDVHTLRALEEALLDFAGCAVVISHDRWFLDRIATHMLAFEGNSQVYWFEGNYSEYEENREQRLGSKYHPERVQYKKLMRD
ncbi:energy-dependent translational throttle protein EttA [Aliifodinibius salipaludis]|uniref:Energy-dependent translational throttle protein EttA n=1 Tax=Fodinibius salipaludis TaxID=2032627 RepID=A0A2A2G9Z9_9BACT|nr:energy-dependent translational throttle protein EttA [Aliifodinibius salipaludis]PAU94576.1 energy-dependent translational throttle protein EttA [Aliifodinibius salipaludis]